MLCIASRYGHSITLTIVLAIYSILEYILAKFLTACRFSKSHGAFEVRTFFTSYVMHLLKMSMSNIRIVAILTGRFLHIVFNNWSQIAECPRSIVMHTT